MQCALPSITGYWMKALSSSFSSADIKIFTPFRRGTRSQNMLRNKRPDFSWSFLWPLCAKGWGCKEAEPGCKARRGWGKEGFRFIRNEGELLGKKMSLHWKKGLEPNSSQVTSIEACRKLTERQRKTSRTWSPSALGDSILKHKLLEDGGREHYYKLFPKQLMGCCPRQEHRSGGPFINHLRFFYVPHSQFCNYKQEFLRPLSGFVPFPVIITSKMSAPSLRTLKCLCFLKFLVK